MQTRGKMGHKNRGSLCPISECPTKKTPLNQASACSLHMPTASKGNENNEACKNAWQPHVKYLYQGEMPYSSALCSVMLICQLANGEWNHLP
jgi:hypothetical protein